MSTGLISLSESVVNRIPSEALSEAAGAGGDAIMAGVSSLIKGGIGLFAGGSSQEEEGAETAAAAVEAVLGRRRR